MKTYRSNDSDFMKEVEEMFNEDEPKKKVDWENLAKNLEQALTDEIKENERMQKEMIAVVDKRNSLQKEIESLKDKLYRLEGIEHHVKHLEKDGKKIRDQLMQQLGVITYLENKIGYNSVRGD